MGQTSLLDSCSPQDGHMLIVLNKPLLPLATPPFSIFPLLPLGGVNVCSQEVFHVYPQPHFSLLSSGEVKGWGLLGSYSVGAQLVSVKWDVICGGVAFIKPRVLAADTERWQAGKWSVRWPLRCLGQIDSSKLTAEPLSSLQRLSAEHNVNYKTDTFAPVGYTLQQLQAKRVHINRHFHQ